MRNIIYNKFLNSGWWLDNKMEIQKEEEEESVNLKID